MLEIKQTLLWRADAGTCCARSGPDLALMLLREVDLLEKTLEALEAGDNAQAVSWLDDYILFLERNYGNCYPDYC